MRISLAFRSDQGQPLQALKFRVSDGRLLTSPGPQLITLFSLLAWTPLLCDLCLWS